MAAEPKPAVPSYRLLQQLRRLVLRSYEAQPPLSWVQGPAGLWFRPSPAVNLRDPRVRDGFNLNIRDRYGSVFNLLCVGSDAGTGEPTVSVSSSNFIRWVGAESRDVLQFCEAIAELTEIARVLESEHAS